MSPDKEIREVFWRAEQLMHRDAEDFVLPRLFTVIGLKVLADSAPWFEQQGYQLPDQARWAKLKQASHLSSAILEALEGLAAGNPTLRFLRAVEPAWLAREEVLGQLMLLIDTLDLQLDGTGAWEAFGRIVDVILDRTLSRRTEERQTAPTVNDLMAALLAQEPLTTGTVYDPTCGVGGTLVAASRAFSDDHGALTYYGQDVAPNVLYVCTWNLLLHGMTRFQLAQGDVFTEPRFLSADGTRVQLFDRVVADPPLGMMRHVEWGSDPYQRFRYGALKGHRADYGFLQHVLASTQSTGIGMLLLLPSVLARSGFEQDIRRNLVQADVIDTIVTLPAGSLSYIRLPVTLMIVRFQKSSARRQSIRMVDTTSVGERRRILDDTLIAQIVQMVHTEDDVKGLARTVPLAEIVAHDFNLVPGVYLADPVELVLPAEMAQRVRQAEAAYEEAHRILVEELDRLAQWFPNSATSIEGLSDSFAGHSPASLQAGVSERENNTVFVKESEAQS